MHSLLVVLASLLLLQSAQGQGICGDRNLVAVRTEKTLNSPGYPGFYPRNTSCSWRISKVDVGNFCLLQLRSKDFVTEATDFLEVFYNNTDSRPRRGIYSNQLIEQIHIVAHESISLKFTSLPGPESRIGKFVLTYSLSCSQEDYPKCQLPSSYTDACAVKATSMGCTTPGQHCCIICPGSACVEGSVSGTKQFTASSNVCQAAVKAGVYTPCGSHTPVYFWNLGDNSFEFYSVKLETQPNTALLIRNFRLKNETAPKVSCYGPVAEATLNTGPIDTKNNHEMGLPLTPVSSQGDSHKEFHFDLREKKLAAWVNSYMCDFIGDKAHPEVLSPTGFAFYGKTKENATMEPSALTAHLNFGNYLTITLPRANKDSYRVWELESNNIAKGRELAIANASCTHAGMYRLRSSHIQRQASRETQGFIRTVVTRDAKMGSRNCSGGLLVHGSCVCPPGLYGPKCKKACRGLAFGRQCEYSLPKEPLELRGAMLCLPDPYGCHCVPGFYGIDCQKPCPQNMFGSQCMGQCHCEGNNSCLSFNGRCLSDACAPGYQGDNCQQVCESKRYGASCNKRCNCRDEKDCDHIHGPKTNCSCEPMWQGAYCNLPVILPRTVLKASRQNPGISPEVTCLVTGSPLPSKGSINVTVFANKSWSLLQIERTLTGDGNILVRAVNLPAYKEDNELRFLCCARTSAGENCTETHGAPYNLLYLKKPPEVVQTSSSSFKLRFDGWTKETGVGDEPAEAYRGCYRSKGTEWQTTNATLPAGCDTCSMLIKGLQPDTDYDLAVSVKRAGGNESWGECRPIARDFTQEAEATRTDSSERILNKLEAVESRLDSFQESVEKCCCGEAGDAVGALASDCQELFRNCCRPNGVYDVAPQGNLSKSVWCQHGWTRVLLRTSNNVDFNRPWEDYKRGFGNKTGDHWIGLETLHQMTRKRPYRFRVEMLTDTQHVYSGLKITEFGEFAVKDEASNYTLHLRNVSRNDLYLSQSTERLLSQHGSAFSTKDKDMDNVKFINCALKFGGGWWLGDQCVGASPTSNMAWLADGRCTSKNKVCAFYGLFYARAIEVLITPA